MGKRIIDRPIEEQLRFKELYLIRELSVSEVAEVLGISKRTVNTWAVDMGYIKAIEGINCRLTASGEWLSAMNNRFRNSKYKSIVMGDNTAEAVVYKITLPANNVYIGKTFNLSNRVQQHRHLMQRGEHHSPYMNLFYKIDPVTANKALDTVEVLYRGEHTNTEILQLEETYQNNYRALGYTVVGKQITL